MTTTIDSSADLPHADAAPADASANDPSANDPSANEATTNQDARSPRRRRPRWLRVLVWTVVVLLIAGAVWAVWFSSLLSTRTVRVVGVPEGPAASAVLAAAQVAIGVPLARVDTSAAQQRVAALDWVATADVRRGWPNEVVVAVAPRTAIARVGTGDRFVDATGASFQPATAPTKADRQLPLVQAEGSALAAASQVLADLPPRILGRLVSIAATTVDDVTLTLRSGDQIRWGSADEASRKIEVLAALMQHRADVYDVTSPETPTLYRAP